MTGALAPELAAVRERLQNDTPFWARNCATILTVEKRPVRLEARPWQLDFDAALERQRAAGIPMRAIILKARKLGFSTWVQAKFMQRVTQRAFQYALTVAHRKDAGRVLFDMAKLIYDRLPVDRELAALLFGEGTSVPAPFSVRPAWLGGTETARQSGGYMSLGDRTRLIEASIYEVLTAGAKGGGRASTPWGVHGSEVAHWEDVEYLTGLLNAVPMIPDTLVVLESTANGFNHFYETWDLAERGAEDPETGVVWTPLFYGWQANPFNTRPFVSDQQRDRFERTIGDPDGGGDKEEVLLVETFGVTLEQLNWRRAILNGPECRGRVEWFHQEHPATPEQAFIGSGNPVFAGILITKAIEEAKAQPGPVAGVLRVADEDWTERSTRAGTIRIPRRALWVPEAEMDEADRDLWGYDNPLLVWEHPRRDPDEVRAELEEQGRLVPADVVPGAQAALDQAEAEKVAGQYIVFADIAQGAGTAEQGDWTAVQVLDHVERVQVARWRTRIAIHELPLLLYLIGLYFNEAVLAPEVTGLGIGPTDALAKDYRYRRMYRRRRAGDDQRQDPREQLIGWETTLRTKPLMEQTFGAALGEGTHGMRDVLTGREFTTYVEDDRGRHGAQPGAHDDLAMSYMGVHRVAAELRPRDLTRKKSGRGRSVRDPLTGY